MIQSIPPSTAERLEAAYYPSLENPAIALCAEIWLKIHAATLQHTKNLYAAERCAAKAFRLAMPPLSGYRNICDFIACAGYGMLTGSIKADIGTKLLYAAQVALATVPRESKTQTRNEPPPRSRPTPPPLLPQPHKKKRISPKTLISPHHDKELTAISQVANFEPPL